MTTKRTNPNPMNTETEYMNGGVTSNLIKLAMESGYVPGPDEVLTMKAHDAMPKGVLYTQSQLEAKRSDVSSKERWDSFQDGYEDLYGPWAPVKPARRSAYDRKHYPRP